MKYAKSQKTHLENMCIQNALHISPVSIYLFFFSEYKIGWVCVCVVSTP
jgi:hypothetical protein